MGVRHMQTDEKKLREVLCDVFPELEDEGDFSLERPKSEYEDWDSFTQLELISGVEEAFGISFQIDEVVKIASANDVLELIRAKSGT